MKNQNNYSELSKLLKEVYISFKDINLLLEECQQTNSPFSYLLGKKIAVLMAFYITEYEAFANRDECIVYITEQIGKLSNQKSEIGTAPLLYRAINQQINELEKNCLYTVQYCGE